MAIIIPGIIVVKIIDKNANISAFISYLEETYRIKSIFAQEMINPSKANRNEYISILNSGSGFPTVCSELFLLFFKI